MNVFTKTIDRSNHVLARFLQNPFPKPLLVWLKMKK